ncbi:MAG: CHASE2 domain-containing protein [Chitinophagales bacterium]
MANYNKAKPFLPAIIMGLLVLVSSFFGIWERAELGLYDGWFRLNGRHDPGQDIVIIGMDENSISKLGRMPWSRDVHAELLQHLSQAKVVAFDVVFDLESEASADAKLAEAIKQNGHVILGSMFAYDQDKSGQWLINFKSPIELFSQYLSGIGFCNMSADEGNTVREVSVVDINFFHRPFPSFNLAVWMAAEGLNPDDLSLTNNRLQVGNHGIQLDSDNQTLINFWGPGSTFKTYSYIDVLEGRIPDSTWANKIVMVGITSPAEKDYYENPFTKGQMMIEGALPAPGVEIHASAVKTYLTSTFFSRAPGWLNLIILICTLILTLLAARRSSPWAGFATVISLAVILSVSVYLFWLWGHYWINLAAPLAMIAFVYIGSTADTIIRSELEKARIRNMFSRYVSSSIVEELIKHGEKLELGGITRDVTVLFSDIRGFTSYSEGKPAEDIVARLNEYFSAMVEIIFANDGTLDKYMGDGLMAIFGAPVPHEDHAMRALTTARQMLEKIEELNWRWDDRGEATMNIGIAINSGPVVVGNIGSPKRMEYTAIGAEVNLASRLESLNKEYHTTIIISGHSIPREDLLPESWSFKDLGVVHVRGLREAVNIFTVDFNSRPNQDDDR